MSKMTSKVSLKATIKEHTQGNVVAKPRREEKTIDKKEKK